VTDELVNRYLFTAGVPDPDLIIRTSGELRVSNFLIWQAAYSEWYITPTFWPDFDKDEYRRALEHLPTATGAMERYLPGNYRNPMRRRLITALGLAVIGLPAIIFGGVFYYLLMGTFLIGAAWEYVHFFRAVKFDPNMIVTVGGVAVVTFMRMFFPEHSQPVFAIVILAGNGCSFSRIRART
jgi:hypothetical protein